MSKKSPPRRPYQVAEVIKCWIVDKQLAPGDRLPSELELMETLQVSKGTVRESTRVLEAQGLVETRTGPGGGAFVREMSDEKAISLLSNYLFFKEISIKDIYQIRLALEPEMAASLAGKVSVADMVRLRDSLHSYSTLADDSEAERQQHLDSLNFHLMLAELSGGNQLLTFIIRFTIQVLSNLTIYHRLYGPATHDLGPTGCQYHSEILDAIEVGDAESAYTIMREHMLDAQRVMNQQEAQVRRGFLSELAPTTSP